MKVGKKTRIGLYSLVGLIALFVLAHTPPAKLLVRWGLVRVVSGLVDGVVTVERLDYKLWRGELEVLGLSVDSNAKAIPFSVSADRIHARVSPTLMLTGEVDGLDVLLVGLVEHVKSIPPELRAKDPIKKFSDIGIRLLGYASALRITDGTFRMRGAPESGDIEEWLSVGGITADAVAALGGHRVVLHSPESRVRFGGEDQVLVELDAIDADLVASTGNLSVDSLSAFMGDSFMRAEGDLDILYQTRGTLDVRYALDGSLAALLDEELEITGVATGEAQVDVELKKFDIETVAVAESIEWQDLVVQDVEAAATLSGGVLQVEHAGAAGFGGEAYGNGEIELNEAGRQHIELFWAGIDVVDAVRRLAGETLPVATRVSGDARLQWTGWNLEDAAGDAHLIMDPEADLAGDLHAELQDGKLRLGTDHLELVPWSTTLTARAAIDIRESGLRAGHELQADYELRAADISQLAELAPGLPVSVSGAMLAAGDVAGSLEEPVWVAQIASEALTLERASLDLSGRLEGSTETVILHELRVDASRGSLSATGEAPLSPDGAWAVTALFEGLGLDTAEVPLGATIDGTIEITGAALDPDLSATLQASSFSAFGADGAASLVADKSGREIRIRELDLEYAGGSLDANGGYALDSGIVDGNLQMRGLRFSDLPFLAEYVPGLEGHLQADASVAGTIEAPEGRLSFSVEDLVHNDEALPGLVVNMEASDGRMLIDGTREDGVDLLAGELQLHGEYPLHAELDLDAMPLTNIFHSIPYFADRQNADWHVAGLAELDVHLATPEALTYGAHISSVELRFPDRTIRASAFELSGNLDQLDVAGFEVTGERIRLTMDGTIPLRSVEALDVVTEGTLDLAALERLDPELTIDGQAEFNLSIGGSVSEPTATGDLSVRDARGSYRDLRWSSLNLGVSADGQSLGNIQLNAEVLDGTVSVTGALPLRSTAPNGVLEVDIQDIDLASFLPPEHRTSDLSLITSASGRIEAPASDLQNVSGVGTIDSIDIRAGQVTIDTAGVTPWRLEDGELSIPEFHLAGEGGELNVRLNSLRLSDGLVLRGTADGRLVAEILNPIIATYGMRVRGEATLDLVVDVADDEVSLTGHGSIRDGRFTSFQPSFTLADANAEVEFLNQRAEITRLEAQSGSGRITGGGHFDWSDSDHPSIDLRLEATDMPAEIMGGFRSEISGELQLTNQNQRPTLSGEIVLDRGHMTREFDSNRDALGAHSVALRDPTLEQGLLSGVGLDLVIRTERNIYIDNSTARLEGAGSISVTGTVAAPELGGVLTVMPGGFFRISNSSFEVVSGQVDLTGFPQEAPFIDIQALTRVGTTTIHIELEGSTNDVRTTLTSPENPELTEGDLASLLVTGRTLEDAGEGGQQIAATWMMSSLAGLVHEGLGNLISFGPPPGAGPLILSEETDPTARLSFGIPVTDRLSVTYSMALDSSERRLWILDYRVARNFWIRAIQENSNDYALGISQRLNFDIRRRVESVDAIDRRPQFLRAISIEGLPPEHAQTPKIQEGDRFDYWNIRDEAAALREDLLNAGYLSTVVDVDTEITSGDTEDAVSVNIIVSPGTRSAIVWRGDDPGRSIRNAAERAWDGRVPEEVMLRDLARRVRVRLQADRYFMAAVTTSVEEVAESAEDGGTLRQVVFDVARGERGGKVVLTFEGNDALSDDELIAALPGTKTPEFFLLLEQPSELERGIRLRYTAEGYLDATSGTPQTRYVEATNSFHVEILVDEGPLVRITEVEFGEGLSLDPHRLQESFGVVASSRIDFPEIQAGQARLRTLYRNEGFSEVRVRAALNRTEEGVSVALLIDEGTRALVGEIRVVGSSKTHPSVVLNQVSFSSGDPIRITDFQRTQKRLYDLGLFRTVDVRPDPAHQGRDVQDVLIQAVERPDVDLSYGLRYNLIQSEQSISLESEPRTTGLEATARVSFINPFTRGNTLGFSIFYQKNHQLFRTTFRMPTFFRQRIITELILEKEKETFFVADDYPSLVSDGSGITFQQTKKLSEIRTGKMSLQWNIRFSKFRADRFDDEGERKLLDTNRTRFGISLIEDRRDSFANPTRGRFWNVTFQGVPEIWGSDVGYVRLYGQVFLYFPIFKSVVWASGFRAGVSTGTQELLLIEDRFQAGGANSVRGYKQNTLGPAVFFELPDGEQSRLYIGGQAVTVINQELRFPIWKIVRGGVYWDAGNVWARAKEFSFDDLRHTVGAGVRFVLSFGALRFDYAKPLNPCTGDQMALAPISPCAADTVRFHFSFGYAF